MVPPCSSTLHAFPKLIPQALLLSRALEREANQGPGSDVTYQGHPHSSRHCQRPPRAPGLLRAHSPHLLAVSLLLTVSPEAGHPYKYTVSWRLGLGPRAGTFPAQTDGPYTWLPGPGGIQAAGSPSPLRRPDT